MKKSITTFALATILMVKASALSIFDVNAFANANPGVETTFAGNTPNAVSYKYDLPGTESGALAAFLSTSVSGFTATVTWAPTGSMEFDTIFLKAGNGHIKWDVSTVDWSTYDGFSITNDLLMNKKGNAFLGISHVSAIGDTVPPQVPDAGTSAILLGLGLLGLGVFRRRIR